MITKGSVKKMGMHSAMVGCQLQKCSCVIISGEKNLALPKEVMQVTKTGQKGLGTRLGDDK